MVLAIEEDLYMAKETFDTKVGVNDFRVLIAEKDESGFSVLIKDEVNQIEAWIDVWLHDGETQVDWNKYIFMSEIPQEARLWSYQQGPVFAGLMFSIAEKTVIDSGWIIPNSVNPEKYLRKEYTVY